MTLRIALIGCVNSSQVVLQTLLSCNPRVKVTGLITRRSSTFNSDFVDLTPLAIAHDVPVIFADDLPDDYLQAEWLRSQAPDLVICVGWSRLLGQGVLNAAPHGVIGFHPAHLPANRGRHPLVWALALGLTDTASTFFLMDDEADSGPILSQVQISIDVSDDAATLYSKILAVIPGQINEIVTGLLNGGLAQRLQDNSKANYWRKRTIDDGRIDWRMNADSIYNLVRALTRPYLGAHLNLGNTSFKVWKCYPTVMGHANTEPGKVIGINGRNILVKCGSGTEAVMLTEHNIINLPRVGDYL